MTYIKKVIMGGFKSFAGKTEVTFDKGINTIVGPNGAGKSNISDALCFVLGRLSIKSMRAAKARNLLFMGSKTAKPAGEAFVELILDNSKNTFSLPQSEISLKRTVRRNGQSIYKINGQTKTRGEVIETLAQAGIDPYGFNIILQGQIQSIIKVHSEERRKIIEEVAGISIYESRKEKSIKELEKTDTRLSEISTILRERTAFLRNLENERAQALKYKDLEHLIKRCKVSIISKKIDLKKAELNSIRKSIEQKSSQKDKVRSQSDKLQQELESLNNKINQINRHIQQSSGIEQDKLNETITTLKAELEGLRVRKENYANRKIEVENRIEQMQASIPEYETDIEQLKKESPLIATKQKELKKKKEELAEVEENRKNIYKLQTELRSSKERLKDKESQLSRISAEADSVIKQVEEYTNSLHYSDKESCQKAILGLQTNIKENKNKLEKINKSELNQTKLISSAETQIKSAEKIKSQIQNLDTGDEVNQGVFGICPLCQNKMTREHVRHVEEDSNKKIQEAREIIITTEKMINKIIKEKNTIQETIQNLEKSLIDLERELPTHNLINDKQEHLKKLVEQENLLKEEAQSLESKRETLEKKTFDLGRVEDLHSSKILEIEEISSRTEKDLDTALLYKERELEKFRDVIKRSKKDIEEIESEMEEISDSMDTKSENLGKKEEDERKLNEKFKQLFKERDSSQERIQKESYNLSTLQNETRQIEDQINHLKIGNAQLNAQEEALEMELKDYPGVELIKASTNVLQDRLQKSQQTIQTIGSINLRALEIYDDIKKEYDKIREKVDILEKEKHEILKIMEEIDNKKKKNIYENLQRY